MKTLRTASVVPILLGTLVACEPGHEHPHPAQESGQEAAGDDHAAGHTHGDGVAIGITRWTDALELFAEHPPAVAGEEMPFLAHLTLLEGFAPLEDATVTLVLEGPATVEGTVDEMLRSGIFQPAVTPPRAGSYEARLEVRGPVVRDTIAGFSIEAHPSEEAALEAHVSEEADAPAHGATVSFLKEQQWKVPFGTAFAARRTLVPTVAVAGEVTTPPNGRAHVSAPTAGRVLAPGNGLPRPGQAVEAGQRLATIAPSPSSPEDAARASLAVAEARARLSSARRAVERNERLLEAEAIPERHLEEARRELTVAEEALQAARRARRFYQGASTGRGGGTWQVSSPLRGTVVEVRTHPGESVPAGRLLFRIVDSNELWLRARVPEQHAARISTGADASYRMAGTEEWRVLRVAGAGANASVVSVDPTVDPESRTVSVLYALEEPDPGLRIGGLVHMAIPLGEPTTGVAVPSDAVIERDGTSVLYVQLDGESFEERTVEVGTRAGEWITVERGLAAGERVVTRGGNLVRIASRAGAAPSHGHVH